MAMIGFTGLPAVAGDCETATAVMAELEGDPMFARPYIDLDEWRAEPVRHRYVHGGFQDTDTRFSFYLPPTEQYEGRFFQYITPVPDNEYLSQGASREEDKIAFSIDSGAYFIETNGGGREATGGPGRHTDPSISAYRANAAAARYSRIVAMQMYGCRRPFGYAFGGSGGGYRTIGGMENTEGVWDGAVPYVIGSPMAIPNVFTARMYALRILDEKLPAIADAVDVGSDVEVSQLLDEQEAAAFEEVTRMGFPREAWYVHDALDLHGYAALFPGVVAMDPDYFTTDFWNKPGYDGFRPPASLKAALIDHSTTVKRVFMSQDLEDSGVQESLLANAARGLADNAFEALLRGADGDAPVALQLGTVPKKDLLGAEVLITSGAAKGQRLLVSHFSGDVILLGASGAQVAGLKAGDHLQIDNRNYLASQTYHRHQVPPHGYPVWDQFRDENGKPLYPQRPRLLGPMFTIGAAGSVPNGKFTGKMIVLSNLYDTEAYPWQGDWYLQEAKAHLGSELDQHLRLWYTDRATHGDRTSQVDPTQTVSYLGVLQQALRDVSAWVEEGEAPPATTRYRIVEGQVHLPANAAERGGIQPVIELLANGAARAEVAVGEAVKLNATITVPPGTGKIVEAAWDLLGDASFGTPVALSGEGREQVTVETSHRFDTPGTYFVTLRAASQREGDTATPFARIQNLERVRVVVN